MIVQKFWVILQIKEMNDARTREEVIVDLMNRPALGPGARGAQAGCEELAGRIARAVGEDGAVELSGGLRLRRASSPTELDHGVSFPALCVVA